MSVNLQKLDSQLRDAGIPIISVQGTGDCGDPFSIPKICDGATIQYDPAATGGQITQGNSILAGHDPSSPVLAYSKAFETNKRIIFKAFYTFTEAFRTASATPTLAEYRTALGNTLSILLTLPASFTSELAHEQAGLGLPNAPVSGWTLAQCQGWHTLLSGWLGRAMAGVVGALAGNID